MTAGLTKRQSDVLAFIEAHVRERGHSPSYQEIAEAVGLVSKGRIAKIIDNLEERGRIRRIHGRYRCIEVVGGSDFHLNRLLDAIECSGFIGGSDPIVAAARDATGRRP